MKKIIVLLFLTAGVIIACNQAGNTSEAPVPGQPGDNLIVNSFCPDTTHPNELCPQLPYDVNESFGLGYTASLNPNFQPPFDIFSWQTFAALNWPSDSAGNPVGSNIGDHPEALRVWEHYASSAEIFNSNEPLFLQVKDAKKNNLKYFYMTSKSPHQLDSLNGFQEADGYPLIDRNLNFCVFDVNVNPVEADFIAKNNLSSKTGIDSFYQKNGKQFQLPASNAATKNVGSMEIKTSWRILDTSKGDIPSRYYTRDAVIAVAAINSVSGKAFTIRAKVGLVGMHIIRKTSVFNKWIWSTFEQVDNTPDNIQEAQTNPHPAIPWSFYYPTSLGLPPDSEVVFQSGDNGNYKFSDTAPYAKRYAVSVAGEAGNQAIYGSQALREYPIYYRTEQVNALWRAKLKGTVWANYKLIGSQWTLGDAVGATPNVPAMLGNSTMETFMLRTSSCIGCHNFAGIKVAGTRIPTDLSWMIAINAK